MEGDLALRLEKKHDIVEFSKYVGHHFYHLEHYPSLTAYKDRNGPATPRKKNEPVFENLSYSVNDEDWGLWSSNEVLIQNYKLIKKMIGYFLINKIFFVHGFEWFVLRKMIRYGCMVSAILKKNGIE